MRHRRLIKNLRSIANCDKTFFPLSHSTKFTAKSYKKRNFAANFGSKIGQKTFTANVAFLGKFSEGSKTKTNFENNDDFFADFKKCFRVRGVPNNVEKRLAYKKFVKDALQAKEQPLSRRTRTQLKLNA